MAKRPMRDFPRPYKSEAEAMIHNVQHECRTYMLQMTETAECQMPDRQYLRRPREVLLFALETILQRLSEQAQNERHAIGAVDDLLTDLGMDQR